MNLFGRQPHDLPKYTPKSLGTACDLSAEITTLLWPQNWGGSRQDGRAGGKKREGVNVVVLSEPQDDITGPHCWLQSSKSLKWPLSLITAAGCLISHCPWGIYHTIYHIVYLANFFTTYSISGSQSIDSALGFTFSSRVFFFLDHAHA